MLKKSLTLMEIVIAVLIMSLTMVGLLNVIFSSRKHTLHSRSRIAAAEVAGYFLEPLQMQVRQDLWNTTSCLGAGTSCPAPSVPPIDEITYTGVIAVIDPKDPTLLGYSGFSGTTLKKVKTTITWHEP